MRQLGAIMLDQYRELNSKKLFWLTLVISGVLVAAFACIGINERGLKLLIWEVESDFTNTKFIHAATFYKGIFVSLGISIWLTWGATILALVSTAGIFPDLMTGGSIDLLLSKPISRARLFLLKFLAGLLFVGLQVSLFTVLSFLVIGIRGGAWEPGLFLAIPIVLCFFSYIYSICVFIGVVTRSTIAALLLTMLAWLMIFVLHAGESTTLLGRIGADYEVAAIEKAIDGVKSRNPDADLTNLNAELQDWQHRQGIWSRIETLVFTAKTVLPKTSETTQLLGRVLVESADLPETADAQPDLGPFIGRRARSMDVIKAHQVALNSRSVTWIVGTSLCFTLVLVSLSGWIFCRRDY